MSERQPDDARPGAHSKRDTVTASERSAAVSSEPPDQGVSADKLRPFMYLYLVTKGESGSESRDETRLIVQNLSPRPCGMIVEMLYVPLGRSGSADETYLIYEQPEEFMRALSFAQQLDATAGAGSRNSWSAGVGALIEVLGQGAAPDDALVARCESAFAEAAQDSALPGQQRWAAAVLAGKMAADYGYDYEKARAYFDSALRQAKSESLEAMTAEWWRADTFMQEAMVREANEAYEDILNGYTHRYPKSHVIEQSDAILKKNKKP